MTRVGWVVLSLMLVTIGAFLAMTRFGGTAQRASPPPVRVAVPALQAGTEGTLAVPVQGVARASIRDSWGDARGGGTRGHHGTDIMAPGGTPVLAAAAGRVEKLFQSRLGGTTLYVRSPDRRWVYYYAHLASYAGGMREGKAIVRGERLGFVGDTGDAGAGNFHLHFGMQRMRPGERWWQGEDVNPYPMLAGRGASR